jgi:hypothetical protein
MKRLLAERLIAHYAPARERYNELLALPHEIDNILGDGAARLLLIVTETMREVKRKVGLASSTQGFPIAEKTPRNLSRQPYSHLRDGKGLAQQFPFSSNKLFRSERPVI